MRPSASQTKPCEYCGKPITRTLTQQSQRKHWTCDRSCANKRRIQLGHTPGWSANPYRGQKATRPCAECGKPITRYLTLQNAERAWTCSFSCMGKNQMIKRAANGMPLAPGKKPRRGDTVPCAVCGKEFYRQPAYIKQGRKYCSRECNAIGQSKPLLRTCAVCGKQEMVKASKANLKHCSLACAALAKTTRPTGRMHNGRPVIESAQGYYLIYEPTHPAAHKHNGRVLEHRWVVERAIGRSLTKDEQVDHINQDKKDNRLENLQILSARDHTLKTTADRMAEIRRLRLHSERLAEYERRFGPLDA